MAPLVSLPKIAPATAASPQPTPRAPRTQTDAARAAMTPESSKLVPDGALDYRLGKGTLAGSLNDSVRFRVRGTGTMSEREFVPDSPAAHALMQSKEGARLVDQLRVANHSIDGLEGVSKLRGFILPRNTDSVMANSMLGSADSGGRQGTAAKTAFSAMAAAKDSKKVGKLMRQSMQADRKDINDMWKQGVAAWNQDGWIVFRPDVARSMLTSTGAYTPAKGELSREAGRASDLVNHVPTHEVQHSASQVSGRFYNTPGKWLEESVAEMLSDTPGIKNRTARANGVNPKSYAGQLAHDSKVDIGWGKWLRPKPSAAQQKQNEQEVGRNYDHSQDVLRDMLHMAGYKWRSNAEVRQTRDFLQTESVETLPRRLAAAIADKQGIPASRQKELAGRIATVVDDPKGLEKLRKDFGIK